MAVRVQLLGGVAIWHGDAEVPLATQRRLLLALLASRRGRPITAGQLVDELFAVRRRRPGRECAPPGWHLRADR